MHELHVHQIELDMQNETLRQTQIDLEVSRDLYLDLYEHAPVGYLTLSTSGMIQAVNLTGAALLGMDRERLLGRRFSTRVQASEGDRWQDVFRRACNDLAHHQADLTLLRGDGTPLAVRLDCRRHDSAASQAVRVTLSDITELREHQRQLEYIAHYDALTHLPNRVLLAERMQQAMSVALQRNNLLAIAYLDLDGFKAVNDVHGHETGDRVLAAVAARMKHTLRCDCTLSRLGGDEFVVMMVDLEQLSDTQPMLERLLVAAGEPVQVGSVSVDISASIGVSYFPQPAEISADQLLRQADQAMYQAKLEGKNRFHVFDALRDLHLRGRNARLDRLDRALRDDEFVLYYQPKVNLRSGAVVGCEALIRWQHPEKGLIAPEGFLPLTEGNRLSEVIGDWVIDSALGQMAAWLREGVRMPVSVNVGARQLQQMDFVSRLSGHLSRHPSVMPGMLMIEILETSALEDMDGVSRTINACAALGVRFALDDFGTGYSSLTYLKRLPVAQLKIDQTFVQDMLADTEDQSILQAILGLAAAFGREVIAEGVNSADHGKRLLQLGCEVVQGFGIAEPMPAALLPRWVAAWQAAPAWQPTCPTLR
ncbi:MAG: EAL domain-containing protein [Pseudomonas sp.]|nr:EAL domain-containing protein [Pseudomonas sp.]